MDRRLDYLDCLIVEAVRQGWEVRQNLSGAWMFSRGTFRTSAQVDRQVDLIPLIFTLRDAGLRFPAE